MKRSSSRVTRLSFRRLGIYSALLTFARPQTCSPSSARFCSSSNTPNNAEPHCGDNESADDSFSCEEPDDASSLLSPPVVPDGYLLDYAPGTGRFTLSRRHYYTRRGPAACSGGIIAADLVLIVCDVAAQCFPPVLCLEGEPEPWGSQSPADSSSEGSGQAGGFTQRELVRNVLRPAAARRILAGQRRALRMAKIAEDTALSSLNPAALQLHLRGKRDSAGASGIPVGRGALRSCRVHGLCRPREYDRVLPPPPPSPPGEVPPEATSIVLAGTDGRFAGESAALARVKELEKWRRWRIKYEDTIYNIITNEGSDTAGGEALPVRFEVSIGRDPDWEEIAAETSPARVSPPQGADALEAEAQSQALLRHMGALGTVAAGAPPVVREKPCVPPPEAPNLTLHLCCSTLPATGGLCIDSMQFYPHFSWGFQGATGNRALEEAPLFPPLRHPLHPPQAARGDAEPDMHYQGPRLQQRHLLQHQLYQSHNLYNNTVVNRFINPAGSGHIRLPGGGPSAGAATAAGGSGSLYSLNHFFYPRSARIERCRHQHLGHSPVHTVQPVLYHHLRRALAHQRGLDDALALFIHRFAQWVYYYEIVHWRARVARRFSQGRTGGEVP